MTRSLELEIRTGAASVQLTRDEFRERFRSQFLDPRFDEVQRELAAIEEIAWRNYTDHRKSPRTRQAGDGFVDPSYELSTDWLAARAAIADARRLHDQPGPARILVVAGAARSEHTCPGEMSKTQRLAAEACDELRAAGAHADLLDLSVLSAEYGRTIHPCKGCVSTAMPLCHWPCSCYPNHGLGQAQDWMAELYPRWVGAHGVAIVTPVYWFQAPSPLKLMIDRLVCADGGNPDPTTTHGKDAGKAKAIELAGWSYPRHLAGRAFGVIVHGDTEGAHGLRRNLEDWLSSIGMISAGARGSLDRYIGYYRPYATSHDDLDAEPALVTEVRNAMRAIVDRVTQLRAGVHEPGEGLVEPRPK